MKISSAFRIILTLLLGTVLLAGNVAQAQLTPRTISGLEAQPISPQPLPVELAFPVYVSAASPGRYKIVWNLPDGHYLYRHAFQFTLSQQPDSAELPVEVTIPDGLKKNDQFFGDIEAYYGQARYRSKPYYRAGAERKNLHRLSRLRRLGVLLSSAALRISAKSVNSRPSFRKKA